MIKTNMESKIFDDLPRKELLQEEMYRPAGYVGITEIASRIMLNKQLHNSLVILILFIGLSNVIEFRI